MSLTREWLELRDRAAEMRSFTERFGMFGETERRTFRHTAAQTRKAGTTTSGRNDGSIQVIGHAAVFGQPSVEMASNFGVFTEYIDARAFDSVLAKNPDVLLTWDHDTRYPLARSGNGSLELSIDDAGLKYWARCAGTSYAEDLRILMDGDYLDQSSFLFRIAPGGEEWAVEEDKDGNEFVVRTIKEVGDLFDVCVCAAGAYPTTDSGLMRNIASTYARSHGFIAVPSKEEEEIRKLGDIAWGPDEGADDLAAALEKVLPGRDLCVVDVAKTLDKAIVCDFKDYSYWVIPFKQVGDEIVVADQALWQKVGSAWVTTTEGYEANMASAKIRREARMADNDDVETPVEETPVETPVEEIPVEETVETPVEETPEIEEEPRDGGAARLLAEARIRIARAKALG